MDLQDSPPVRDLTPRELEVIALIAEGKRNSEIGVILAIKERTVERHVSSILYKLCVETRTAAVGWFLRREFRAHLAALARGDGAGSL